MSEYSWILIDMASLPSTPPSSSSAVDVAAHCTCKNCSRRMSSYKYDKHSLCISCRDVTCSVDVRCSECSSWSTESMAENLRHRSSLVSKGKKKQVPTPPPPPSMPPSAVPSVSAQSPAPSLLSVANDSKHKEYVQSVLASMLKQPGSQVNLGSNPFLLAYTTCSLHLISPTLNSSDTHFKHFSHSPCGKYPCCLSSMSRVPK